MILSLKTELAQLELTYVYFIYGSPKIEISYSSEILIVIVWNH